MIATRTCLVWLVALVPEAMVGCGGDATPATTDMRTIMFPAGCTNQVQDDDETDVDCGGSCPACDTAQTCKGGKDCKSGLCVNRSCAAPSCGDMVQNGDESDVDCGASCPTACGEGKKCNDGPDCAGGICVNGLCARSPCENGVKDGMETDVDCGGPVCPGKCADGQACSDGIDCSGGMCVNQVCKSSCPAGKGDCDGNAANGCEADLSTDARNCGACGRVCPMNMAACADAKCQALYCHDIGYANCPTGAKRFCDANPIQPLNSTQAEKACSLCLGLACQPNFDDESGPAFGKFGGGMHCDDPYWGYFPSRNGAAGRVWPRCQSDMTFGFWAN